MCRASSNFAVSDRLRRCGKVDSSGWLSGPLDGPATDVEEERALADSKRERVSFEIVGGSRDVIHCPSFPE